MYCWNLVVQVSRMENLEQEEGRMLVVVEYLMAVE